MTDRKFGWRGPGPRDWTRPTYKLASQTTVTHVDRLSLGIPIRDQGSEGACTGHGTARGIQTVLRGADLSPQFAYFHGRVREATQDIDAGAIIADVVAGVGDYGVAPEASYPYVSGQFAARPPADAYVDAVPIKAKVRFERVTGLAGVKHALASGYPVIYGMSFPEYGMSAIVAKTGWLRPPTDLDAFVGGHCMLFDGFDDRTGNPFLWSANSWAASWGLDGWCQIDQRWLTMPGRLVDDMWAVVQQ